MALSLPSHSLKHLHFPKTEKQEKTSKSPQPTLIIIKSSNHQTRFHLIQTQPKPIRNGSTRIFLHRAKGAARFLLHRTKGPTGLFLHRPESPAGILLHCPKSSAGVLLHRPEEPVGARHGRCGSFRGQSSIFQFSILDSRLSPRLVWLDFLNKLFRFDTRVPFTGSWTFLFASTIGKGGFGDQAAHAGKRIVDPYTCLVFKDSHW